VKIHLNPHQKGVAPAWIFVGAGLLIAIGAVKVASLIPMKLLPPCGFHVVTGHPCPTCGSTRVILYLLDGHWLQAFRANPFLFMCLTVLTFWFVAGAVAWLARRDLRVDVGSREERWLWVLLGAAFLANWAYLWIAGI
jgi:hypothetical protein